ncbi:MAG: proline--tRNA ligase [Bryobacterales bacterium]|nr:proline--tRNA ligase [Bryobacterales bacterium]
MRWSSLFIPTLREAPADAEVVSHKLLLRAGYVRQLSAGLYCYLYLAQRSLRKIERIIREEMDAIGAQEIYMPELHPAEVWKESGRWDAIGDDMFRLKDRWGREHCLGMTEEEVVTFIARGELRSYKQLPQIWYQIQAKFRDEPRPKAGLMRVRRFTMKDSYTFDMDSAGLDVAYQRHYRAYCRIFDRCGLECLPVDAHSGAMGGSESCEFMVPSPAGEDWLIECPASGYRANLEKAVTLPRPPERPDPAGDSLPEEFATPGRKTIEEVCAFDGQPATSHIKALLMVAAGRPLMVLLRGDHQLSETKLAAELPDGEMRPARPGEIEEWLGAEAGFIGPVGAASMTLLADNALQGRRGMVAGANKADTHLRNVTPGRDFQARFADLRAAQDGDLDVASGKPVRLRKAIEVGHIFKLGYKYSESMGLSVLDENGKAVTPIMGSYGIGVERVLTGAIEQNHDDSGMALPVAIAPFEAVVTPVNLKNEGQRRAAEELYEGLGAAGVDILLDDRPERAGVKFKDADLIGIPFRLTVGRKIDEGLVELTERSTGASEDVTFEEIAKLLRRRIDEAKSVA